MLNHIAIIFLGSFSLSVVLVFGAGGVLLTSKKLTLFSKMGSATWDFSRSWASNLTVASTLISLMVGLGAIPTSTFYASRFSYSVLSALFLGLGIIAPFIYTMFSSLVIVGAAPNSPQLVTRGTLIVFLLSGTITAWGVLGQMLTLLLMFQEVRHADILSFEIFAFQIVLVAALAGILFYLPRAVYFTVVSQIPGVLSVNQVDNLIDDAPSLSTFALL